MSWEAAEKEEIIVADGYEDAVIGVAYVHNVGHVTVYDVGKCLDVLVTRDGMSYEDAREFFDYNTMRSLPYMGEKAPIFVEPMDIEGVHEFADNL
jgi:hypothetical protein